MKILITGAIGNVGMAVIKSLSIILHQFVNDNKQSLTV
jgi:nucleoside-diphosphate-sugar epimerase